MNNKGYAIKELIILFAGLAVVFGIVITKVVLAYDNIDNKEIAMAREKDTLTKAVEVYIKKNEKNLSKDKENFIYGEDLEKDGYLVNLENDLYDKAKIKITYNKDLKKFNIDIVE